MSRRPKQSLVAMRSEGPAAVPSGSTTNVTQGSHHSHTNCRADTHSDTLSYRAVAARAVGGCKSSPPVVSSAQVVAVSEPAAGSSATDPRAPVCPFRTTGDVGDCSRADGLRVALAAPGTAVGVEARENISTSATPAATTPGASTTRQATLWKRSRQPTDPARDREAAQWEVPRFHLAAAGAGRTTEQRRPRNSAASCSSAAPLAATQKRGWPKEGKNETVAMEDTAGVDELTTLKDDENTGIVEVTTGLARRRRLGGALCGEKNRQQQQRRQSSAHLPHKQQLCTDQESQQRDSTQQHHLHHAQQLLAQQQPPSQEPSLLQQQKQQLLEHHHQGQQELKQHLPTPLHTNHEQNGQVEDAIAKLHFVVASSDGAFARAPVETNDGKPCSGQKEACFPGKGRREIKQQRRGEGEAHSNKLAPCHVVETAHAACSGDSSSCVRVFSGCTSQAEGPAKCHQWQGGERPNTCSSTYGDSCHSILSGSSSTGSTTACSSSDDSGSSGTDNNGSLAETRRGNNSGPHTGTGGATELRRLSGCVEDSAAAVRGPHPQQANCKKKLHTSTTAEGSGSNKGMSQLECNRTEAGQQSNSTTNTSQRTNRNSYCRSKQLEQCPPFEKRLTDNHEGVAIYRRVSVSGGVCPSSSSSSSSRFTSGCRVSKSARTTAGSLVGIDAPTHTVDKNIGFVSLNPAARAAEGVSQPPAETGASFAARAGVTPALPAPLGDSATSDTNAKLTVHQGGCLQNRSTTRSRRGRSTPCTRSMPRGRAHKSGLAAAGPSPAPTASHHPAPSIATPPSGARSTERGRADSSGASVLSVNTCSITTTSDAGAASIGPKASVYGSAGGTSLASDAPLPDGENCIRSALGSSVELMSSSTPGANAAKDLKENSGTKKNKPCCRAAKADSLQHNATQQFKGGASASATSAGTPSAAGMPGNGKKQQVGRLIQVNSSYPSAAQSAAPDAAGVLKRKRCGAVSTAAQVTYSIAARGSGMSAPARPVTHTLGTNPKLTTAAGPGADTRTPTETLPTAWPATPMDSSINARSKDPGALSFLSMAERSDTGAVPNETAPTVSLHKETLETGDASYQCGVVSSLHHSSSVSMSSQACTVGGRAPIAPAASSSLVAFFKKTCCSCGTTEDAVSTVTKKVDTEVLQKAATAEEGDGCVRESAEEAGATAGAVDDVKQQAVEEVQLSKLATLGVERMGVLLPDGSLNLMFFKVFPCRNRNPQHDKKSCPYYHNSRDRRRTPVTYRAEQCEEHFDLDTISVQCSKGEACEKSHNRHELLYHPHIYKQRFCSNFPCILPFKGHDDEHGSHPNTRKGVPCCTNGTKPWGCVRGIYCAFAHSRKEIRATLFTEEEERNPDSRFFVNKFKTIWCPYGSQHDWRTCVYAHTYQDCRRSPLIGYGSEPCAAWNKDLHSADYEKRCPHGARCSYSHGSKEQLYHPSYYKTMPCIDYRPATAAGSNNRARGTAQQQQRSGASGGISASPDTASAALAAAGGCPRGFLCAFYHEGRERRVPTPPWPQFTYSAPLPVSQLKLLQPLFLHPPLFNLDDFEAFGHTSRQTAALRRSQALTNGQSTGDAGVSKAGPNASVAVDAPRPSVTSCETTLYSRFSTKTMQHRSHHSHKLGPAPPSLRIREVGALTSPQQTKWLSNSNPLDQLATNLQKYCLPSPVASTLSGAAATVAAGAVRARSAGSGARASGRKSSVAATCEAAGASTFAAGSVASIIPFEDAGVSPTKETQLLAEHQATAAEDGVNTVGFSSSKDVEEEGATEAAKANETLPVSRHTFAAKQGALYVLNADAPIQQQVHYKLQCKNNVEEPQRGVEQQWQKATVCERTQHNPQLDRRLQNHTFQLRERGQRSEQPQEGFRQREETPAEPTDISDSTENRERDLVSGSVVEVAVEGKESVAEECTPQQPVHAYTEGKSAETLASSNSAYRGGELLPDFAAWDDLSSNEHAAVSAKGRGRAAGAGQVTGGSLELTAAYVTLPASRTSDERTTKEKQPDHLPRPIGALLPRNSTSVYACDGSQQERFPEKEMTGNAGQQTSSIHFATSVYYSRLPDLETLVEHQARNSEHIPAGQPFQTEAHAQGRRGGWQELPQLPQQHIPQHEQGLLQGRDLLVAAISSVDPPESPSSSLRSWHPHLVSTPRRVAHMQDVCGAAGCVQESNEVVALTAAHKPVSGTLVPLAQSPAQGRAISTNCLFEQGLPLQTPFKGQFGERYQSDNDENRERLSGKSLSGMNGSCSSAKIACEDGKLRSTVTVEGRKVAPGVFPPGSPVGPAMTGMSQWTSASAEPAQEHVFPWKQQQQPGNALSSTIRKAGSRLAAAWSGASDTVKHLSQEGQPRRDFLHDVRQERTRNGHYISERSANSVGGVVGHNLGDSLSSSNTGDGNGSISSSSTNSSNSTSSSSSSSSGTGISEGSTQVIASGRENSSRSECKTGRKFVGLFDNGRVWQVPSSGNIRESRGSLWTAAAVGNKTLNYGSTFHWKSDVPAGFTSYSVATGHAGNGPSAECTQPAAGKGYSQWVTPSGCTFKYALPASSPAGSVTELTTWITPEGVAQGELGRYSSIRRCHTSQLLASVPSQCHAFPRLPPEGTRDVIQNVDAVGLQCNELFAPPTDPQAAQAPRSVDTAAAGGDPLEAPITGIRVLAAKSPAAAVSATAAHPAEKWASIRGEILPLWWERSGDSAVLGSASHRLRRPLQAPVRDLHEHIPSSFQLQHLIFERAYDGTSNTLGMTCPSATGDPHTETEATRTAGTEITQETATRRTGVSPLLVTRGVQTETAVAVSPASWAMNRMQTSSLPTPEDNGEGATWRSANPASAAVSCSGTDKNSDWVKIPWDSSSTNYGVSHKKSAHDEHCVSSCSAYSSSNYGMSSLGEGTSAHRCSSPYNCMPPLPEGRQPLWGNALCGAGDYLAADEQEDGIVLRDGFAGSAPPKLYSVTSNPVQLEESQQHELKPEEILRNQQHPLGETSFFSPPLLRPRALPDNQGQHLLPVHFCHSQATGQLRPAQSLPSVCSPTTYERDLPLLPNTLDIDRRRQPESDVDAPCCAKGHQGPEASTIQRHSDEAATAAAAVLDLLDDDEQLERAQGERASASLQLGTGKGIFCCASSATSVEAPAAAIHSTVGPLVTRPPNAAVACSLSSGGDSITMPVSAPPPTETVCRKTATCSQMPLSLETGREGYRPVTDAFVMSVRPTTQAPTSPLQTWSVQKYCVPRDKRINSFSSDDASADATVADGAATAETGHASGHELKLARTNNSSTLRKVAAAFLDESSKSTNYVRAEVNTTAGPRITMAGPLVIGAATAVEQQQLLLLLLRSQLWEKVVVILHPAAAVQSKNIHLETEQDMQYANWTCSCVSIATVDETQGDAQARVEGTSNLAAAADIEAAKAVAQRGEIVAGSDGAPEGVGLGLFGTTGEKYKGSSRRENVGSGARGAPAPAVTNDESAATEYASTIEEEAATIVETAGEAEYYCVSGLMDDGGRQPAESGVLHALQLLGLDVEPGQRHRHRLKNTTCRPGVVGSGVWHRRPHILSQQLLVLTHGPHARLQRHALKTRRHVEKQAEQCQQRPQPAAQHGEAPQHLRTQLQKEPDNERRDNSTLSLAASVSTDRSLLAVIFLHRSPWELNNWLCRLQRQERYSNDCSSSASSSTSTTGNDSYGQCCIKETTMNGTDTEHRARALASTPEDSFGSNQAGAVVTKRGGGAEADELATTALPVGTAVPAAMPSTSVESPQSVPADPVVHMTAPPAGAVVREEVHCGTPTATTALMHVVVLHVVCNCQSSLDLLSHLSPQQQERCIFPQAHELPLWSSFLHGGRSSCRQRRGRSSNRKTTTRRTPEYCAVRTSSSTSRNSTQSNAFMSSPCIDATSAQLPSFASECASVPSKTPSLVTANIDATDTAIRGSSRGMETPCSGAKERSNFTIFSTARIQQIRANTPATQSKNSDTVGSPASHTGNTGMEGLTTRPPVREATEVETQGRLSTSGLPRFHARPSAHDGHTKKLLVGSAGLACTGPASVPESRSHSTTGGYDGPFYKLDGCDTGLSGGAEAWHRCGDGEASAGVKSALSSCTPVSTPTCNAGLKCRSASCSYPPSCSARSATSIRWNGGPLIRSNTGCSSGSLRKELYNSSPEKAAYDVVSQEVCWSAVRERAQQSKLLLALMLVEELGEAKATAASLLGTAQPTAALLCVCCCYGRRVHLLQQQSPKCAVLPTTGPSTVFVRHEEGTPSGRITEAVEARDNDETPMQKGAIQRSVFLDPGTGIRTRCHESLNAYPGLQADDIFEERDILQHCTHRCSTISRKPQEEHLCPSADSSEEKENDSPRTSSSSSDNSADTCRHRGNSSSNNKASQRSRNSLIFFNGLAHCATQVGPSSSCAKWNLQTQSTAALPAAVGKPESVTTTTMRIKPDAEGPLATGMPPSAVTASAMTQGGAVISKAAAFFRVAADVVDGKREPATRDVKRGGAARVIEPLVLRGTAKGGSAGGRTEEGPLQRRDQHPKRRVLEQCEGRCTGTSTCAPVTWRQAAAVEDEATTCTVAYPRMCSVSLEKLVKGCLSEDIIFLPLLQLLLRAPLQSAPQQQQWIAIIPPDAMQTSIAASDGSRLRKGVVALRTVSDKKGSREKEKADTNGMIIEDDVLSRDPSSGDIEVANSNISCSSISCHGVMRYEELWCVLCGKSAAALPGTERSPPRTQESSSSRRDTLTKSMKECINSSTKKNSSSTNDMKSGAVDTSPAPVATMCCLVKRNSNWYPSAPIPPSSKETAAAMALNRNRVASYKSQAPLQRVSEADIDIHTLELACPHAFHMQCVNEVLLPVLRGQCVCQLFVPPRRWLPLRPGSAFLGKDEALSGSHSGYGCSLCVIGCRCSCCGSKADSSKSGSGDDAHITFQRSGFDERRQTRRCSARCKGNESTNWCCTGKVNATPELVEDGQGTTDLMHPYCSQGSQSTAYSNSGRKSSSDSTEGQISVSGRKSSSLLVDSGDSQNSRTYSGHRGELGLFAVKGAHVPVELYVPSTGEKLTSNSPQCRAAPSRPESAAPPTSFTEKADVVFAASGPEKATRPGGTLSAPSWLSCSSARHAPAFISAFPLAYNVAEKASKVKFPCRFAVGDARRAAQSATSPPTPLRHRTSSCCEGSTFLSATGRSAALSPFLLSDAEMFGPQPAEFLATGTRGEVCSVFGATYSPLRRSAAAVPSLFSSCPGWGLGCVRPPLPSGLPTLLATTLEAFARLQQLHAAFYLQALLRHNDIKRPSKSVRMRQQTQWNGTYTFPFLQKRLQADDGFAESSDYVRRVDHFSMKYNCETHKEQSLYCSCDTADEGDHVDGGNSSATTYNPANIYTCSSCYKKEIVDRRKFKSNCIITRELKECEARGSNREGSRWIATHPWDISPRRLQVVFPLIAPTACCTSLKVYLRPLVATWRDPLNLEHNSLSCYRRAAARIMLYLLRGRQDCGTDESSGSCRGGTLKRVNAFANVLHENNSEITGSPCLPCKCIKANSGSRPPSSESSTKVKHSGVSAPDNVHKCSRGNDSSCCNWSNSSNCTKRSSRKPESSSNSSGRTDHLPVHRSCDSNAHAVYASEDSRATSSLTEIEVAAAEACPPLLRHLLLLLHGGTPYVCRAKERSSYRRTYSIGAKNDSGGTHVDGTAADADLVSSAESLCETSSVPRRSAEPAALSGAVAPSASVVVADTTTGACMKEGFEAAKILDSAPPAINDLILRACVQHPFFWDASERMDLLDCCATFFNLQATFVACSQTEERVITVNGHREVALTAPILSTQKQRPAPVPTAMAVAECMAAGWRDRLDTQFLPAVGDTGTFQRKSNVEGLLDFLRTLRFAWNSWILKLPVEQLEQLAQQYAAAPLTDSVEPHSSLRFLSRDTGCTSLRVTQAAQPSKAAASTARRKGKPAHRDESAAARKTLVGATEKHKHVEKDGVGRQGGAVTAASNIQQTETAADVSCQASFRNAATETTTEKAVKVTSQVLLLDGNCCNSDCLRKAREEHEPDQIGSQQREGQVLEAGDNGGAPEDMCNGKIGELACMQADAKEDVYHHETPCHRNYQDGAAQLKRRRRLLRKVLIESRDGALIQQLDSVHPELFLLFCVIAGSSDPCTVTRRYHSHDLNSARGSNISWRDSDVEEAYQVFDAHPRFAVVRQLFGCYECFTKCGTSAREGTGAFPSA